MGIFSICKNTNIFRLGRVSALILLFFTGFEQNDFTVYHRLYDALNITVVSDKNTVGYYDMESKCFVQDAKE